jgi:hypothetical protein
MPAVPIPSPDEKPNAWDTLTFKQGKTAYMWPPVDNEDYGVVKWSPFKPTAKIDKKAKSGAAKPRVTQTGGEAVGFSFTLRIPSHIQEAIDSAMVVLDKLRPGAGPFEFDYPWAAFNSIRGFLVESVEFSPPEGGELLIAVSCIEVNPDAQSGKGGNVTKTPTREAALKRANDEWEARARAAQAFQQNENLNRAQDITDARSTDDTAVAQRTPKKLNSVFVGEGEVSSSPVQPKKTEPAGNVASGGVST